MAINVVFRIKINGASTLIRTGDLYHVKTYINTYPTLRKTIENI